MTTLPVYDGTNAQFIFDLLAQSGVDTGGRQLKLRLGVETISVVAQNNGDATVTHGMGSTPVAVVCTTDQLNWFASADTLDDDSFRIQIREYQGASVTVDVTVYWVALG